MLVFAATNGIEADRDLSQTNPEQNKVQAEVLGASVENIPKDTVAEGDVFEGKITNSAFDPGKIVGVGVYDRNCVNVGNGLLDCHAGIQTKEYGLLDFNHVHNKKEKPCIVSGDGVVVTILNSDGEAKVQRINATPITAREETDEMTK